MLSIRWMRNCKVSCFGVLILDFELLENCWSQIHDLFSSEMHRSKAKLLIKSAINIMMPLWQSCITNMHATGVSHLSLACSKLKRFFGKILNSLSVDEKKILHSWENIYLLISLKYNKRMYWMTPSVIKILLVFTLLVCFLGPVSIQRFKATFSLEPMMMQLFCTQYNQFCHIRSYNL